MEQNTGERRKYHRLSVVKPAQAEFEGSEPIQVLVVDISAGGARIMSQFPISVGEVFTLFMELDDISLDNTQCEIVWTRNLELMESSNFGTEYMGGVKFDRINEELDDFVNLKVNS